MRHVLLLAMMLIAAPATAQIAPAPAPARAPERAGPPDLRETDAIRRTVRQARADGSLDRREARVARRHAYGIDAMAERFASDGLSEHEARELQVRTEVLRAEVNRARLLEPTPR